MGEQRKSVPTRSSGGSCREGEEASKLMSVRDCNLPGSLPAYPFGECAEPVLRYPTNMPHKHRSAVPLLLLALLAAGGAFAQTPAALPQLDVATTLDFQLLASVAVDGQGAVTLLWWQGLEFARGRRFSGEDVPLGPDIVFE